MTRNPVFFSMTIALIMELGRQVNSLEKMKEVFKWDQIRFPMNDSEAARLEEAGIYCSGCSVIFDVDVDKAKNRYFFSMPHILYGSAVTLGYVNSTADKYNPIIEPYPDWSWHANNSGCDGLLSVFRIHVDECNRLWVLDSGDNLQLAGFQQVCPPQLLVFDLATDTLAKRHRFDIGREACPRTLMLTVITEHMDAQCSEDVYAYIADAGDFRLLVYHLGMDKSWAVSGDWFYPEVTARDYSMNGVDFAKMVGVLGIALSPCIDEKCDRYLFFHSFTGFIEGRVLTSILRNSSLFANGNDGAREYIDVIGRRPLQSVDQAMSKEGYLFFGMIGDHALRCWNFHQPYYVRNFHVVEYDYERIAIPMGITMSNNENGEEEVWLLTNHIETLFSGDFTRNTTYPIYVMYGKVKDLVNGTGCEIRGQA